ncbi:hypothetical protein POL68_34055 [Stigmatella sp. ncwal1]|uniref:Uncharacterized protein n=1 Tax=Stigmatella ashevillensis TaxID=2995309 RepID=A0ABT5DIY0_9BACT|nr:hypothetical protein [Stigmatella ashevillena]MDC0713539.1 hypothetical protein [Stigmatella ashevillena]
MTSRVTKVIICARCYGDFIMWIRGLMTRFPSRMMTNMVLLEQAYINRSVIYSDEAEAFKLESHPPENAKWVKRLTSSEIQGGTAPGFTAHSKEFTSNGDVLPSVAVKNFIRGPTVCECEGAAQSVAYNALHDVLGDALFDTLFPRVEMKLRGCPLDKFMSKKQASPQEVRTLLPGEWIYIYNQEKSAFDDIVRESKTGGASSGWNLVYMGDGNYLGFGLSTNTVIPLSLEEVRLRMINSVLSGFEKPKPSSGVKSPVPVLRRRGSGELPSTRSSRSFDVDLGPRKSSAMSSFDFEFGSRRSAPKKYAIGRPGLNPEQIVLKLRIKFKIEDFIRFVSDAIPPAMLLSNPLPPLSPALSLPIRLPREAWDALMEGTISMSKRPSSIDEVD